VRLIANCRALLVPAAVAFVASADGSCYCPLVVNTAITVNVYDSLTLRPAAFGAVGVAVGSGLVDTMRIQGPGDSNASQLVTVRAGAGTYTVTVTKPGYAPWTHAGIRVTHDHCGFNALTAAALLQPLAVVATRHLTTR